MPSAQEGVRKIGIPVSTSYYLSCTWCAIAYRCDREAAGGVSGIRLGGCDTTPLAASSTDTLLLYRICPVARSSSTRALEYAASAATRFDCAVTRSRSARITL